MTGNTQTGQSGILFMAHPENFNSPEPVQTWDRDANVFPFINFVPTVNKNWELLPNGNYILKYRVMTFEGNMTPENAYRLWRDFAEDFFCRLRIYRLFYFIGICQAQDKR
jgi:hypothetical protein